MRAPFGFPETKEHTMHATRPPRTEAVSGDRAPADPAGEDIWSASTSGTGTQSLEWDIEDGDWSAVVMNADGSPGVDVRASAGAGASFLQPLGLGLLGGAVV